VRKGGRVANELLGEVVEQASIESRGKVVYFVTNELLGKEEEK